MINSEKNILLTETEIKPNKYASIVMVLLLCGMMFSWALNEIGIFRVGKWEMRIGTFVPLLCVLAILTAMFINRKVLESPKTKWYIFAISTVFTISMNTLLNFHTTIMLLFPIFVAMLYRSKALGVASAISSIVCTIVSPVFGYILHVWDIPLLQELILIGTNGEAIIENTSTAITMESIVKILLYLVVPRLIMVGSCAMLMFYVIRLGVDHVNNQILLDKVSRRDSLTGLYNQNYFKQILEDKNKHGNIGVIFFDVNGLKEANDTKGHEYGDLLLTRCAKSIADVCDDISGGFRVGGDEFLLLVEGADSYAVDEKYNQWKNSIANINRENETDYDNMICSMAAGCISGRFENLDELIKSADVLMYKNKTDMKA